MHRWKKKQQQKTQNKHDIQYGIYGHKTYVWDKGAQDSCTESGILHKKKSGISFRNLASRYVVDCGPGPRFNIR